ncbi:TorF family putative porin [Undibacterium crateris]|uniref:TorF family putative porin n=1 Tax=Undibacterium crateris TaxID=2528175 RepID=UPI001389783E|nr:TorF family putative porin [Undibacterium crateris]NDI86251.1 hypothetical protein [Undibacterium crateris]
MKKNKLYAALLLSSAALSTSAAWAQEAKPDLDLSFNASLTSDYRYRGISQTRQGPALQGGADLSHTPTGLYAGTWLSTIKWIKDTPGAGSTPLEWDVYAGKKGQLSQDLSYDVGVLGYVYAGNKLDQVGLKDANTLELYGQLNYGPAYLKYSHALTPLFGIVDSKNSGYLDLGANIVLREGLTLNLHAGYQKVQGINASAATYSDYKIGLSQDVNLLGGMTFSLAAIGTNADKSFYASPANGKFMGKHSLVVSVSKTF